MFYCMEQKSYFESTTIALSCLTACTCVHRPKMGKIGSIFIIKYKILYGHMAHRTSITFLTADIMTWQNITLKNRVLQEKNFCSKYRA